MAITSIEAENFSVFSKIKISAAKHINVFIGENGTGKTQLLKSIYAGCRLSEDKSYAAMTKCFKVNAGSSTLVRDDIKKVAAFSIEDEQGKCIESHGEHCINTIIKKTQLDLKEVQKHLSASYRVYFPNRPISATYIPVKDMLTHAKGLMAMSKKYRDFPFDDTLLDIISKANQWVLKEPPELAVSILPVLEKMMKGKVIIENDEFYIQKYNGRKVNFSLEAEGLKKIGLLWQLLMNESIVSDSILLWDEPEASLNPSFMPELVKVLFAISRQGVQIFLSTHSYILAKYIEIMTKNTDEVLFHSLYNEEDAVLCESKRCFRDLQHNTIMNSFDEFSSQMQHFT